MYQVLQIALCTAALSTTALVASPVAAAQPTPEAERSHRFSVVTHSRGQLGAKVITMSEDLRLYFGAPKDRGLLVDQVLPDTPAAKAGLKSGDVVTAVEGKPIAQAIDIFRALSTQKKGDQVSLDIVRNKKKQTLRATLDGKGQDMKWNNSHQGPFHFELNDKDMDFGQYFPFGNAPLEMQEQLRQLEERLKRLEEKTPGSKKTPTKKLKTIPPTTGPQS